MNAVRLRRGQRALRRDDRRYDGSRVAGLDPRLPSGARSGGVAASATRSRDRLLSAHPVPVLRDLPAPAATQRAAAGDARRRLPRIPHRRLRAPLPLLVPARARTRLRTRHDRARRQADRDGRPPDRRRRRELPRDAPRSRDGDRAGRSRPALPRQAARPRRRAPRLHQRDPAEARGIRALPRRGSRTGGDDDDAPGARSLPASERGISGTAGRDREPDRARERPLRHSRAAPRSSTSTAASRRPSSRSSTGART